MLFLRMLEAMIRTDGLEVVGPSGDRHRLGASTSKVTLRLRDERIVRALLLNPRLVFGEAYMDERIAIEHGDIYDALDLLCGANPPEGLLGRAVTALTPVLRHLQQYNPLKRSRANAAHHYDLSRELYTLFLDRDLQYSCAYFPTPGTGLEEAQEAKKRHIASKLLLKPGQRVLDIGCGWGGLGLYLAREHGVEVVGVTLSTEQLAVAKERAAASGLDKRVRFELRDYRTLNEPFDRIVSVGMFEHVGVPHYREFFGKVGSLLTEDGVALLHSIGRSDGPGLTNSWIRKYIFPGGYSPALSEVLPVVESSGLWATDIEILRLHYAETLRHWRKRFLARREEAKRLYDERFCRMWEFYLAASELAFRRMGHMVFQIQLARRQEAVPLTRDYIGEAERAIAARHGQAA
jgi:cyclopropane-fatty-acyl-phospholipid synthase